MSDDNGSSIKWKILAQGMSALISWNAIISSIDWFNFKFDGYRPDFWLPIYYYLPVVCMQPLVIVYSRVFSYNFFIITGYFITFLALLMIGVFTVYLPKAAAFYLVCILNSIMGISNSLTQNGLMGLTGVLPALYISYFMIGFGISGVFISSIRLLFLQVFPSSEKIYNYSTALFFIIGGITQVCSIFIQKQIIDSKIVQEYLEKNRQNRVLYQVEMQTIGENQSKAINNSYNEYKILLSKIWQYCVLIFLNFFITFLLLSQQSLRSKIDGLSYPEYVAWMIFTFNLFDLIGRLTPNYFVLTNLIGLWGIGLMRGLFIVSFKLVAECKDGDKLAWLFGSAFFKFLNMGLYAYSNGFLCTILIINASGKVEDGSKDRVGYFMTSGLFFGIFFGQLASISF